MMTLRMIYICRVQVKQKKNIDCKATIFRTEKKFMPVDLYAIFKTQHKDMCFSDKWWQLLNYDWLTVCLFLSGSACSTRKNTHFLPRIGNRK